MTARGPFYEQNMDALATELIWGFGFRGLNTGDWHRWPAWVIHRAARRPWVIPTWRLPDPNPFPRFRLWRHKRA